MAGGSACHGDESWECMVMSPGGGEPWGECMVMNPGGSAW